MKITKQFLLAIILLLTFQSSEAQIRNADTMVHRIFSVLKARDEKAFVALYPDKDQMVKLMQKMITGLANEIKNANASPGNSNSPENSMSLDSIVLAALKKKATPEEAEKMSAKLEKDFIKTIKEGEEKGVDWNAIQLVKYSIDTISMQDESMVKLFGSNEYKGMKGVLYFNSGEHVFQMGFDQVMFMPEEGGWYGVRFKKLAKEGESMEEEEDLKMGDINMEGEKETTPVKPKTKAKPKTKTNTSSSRTKTKTKG